MIGTIYMVILYFHIKIQWDLISTSKSYIVVFFVKERIVKGRDDDKYNKKRTICSYQIFKIPIWAII